MNPRATSPFAALLAWIEQRKLGELLLFALALRCAWILLCPNEPFSDQTVYHYHASMMALGKGYIDQAGAPTNYYPVGYPALLAPFYAVFGAKFVVAYGVNLILAGVQVAGAFRLGELLYGPRAARYAALFVGIHPTFVLMATVIASENPFCAGTPWALWFFVRAVREPKRGAWLACAGGALVALLAYVRPPALLFLSCPVVFAWIDRGAARAAIANAATAGLTALALLAPWGMRNEQEFGKFSITSFNGGANLYLGNNPVSAGDWMDLPADTESMGLVERDQVLGRRAMAYIKANPGHYAALTLNRIQVTLRSDTIAPAWDRVGIVRRLGRGAFLPLKVACTLAHWALLLGLGATIWRVGKRVGWRGLWPADGELAWTTGLLAFPFVFILGGNRYVLPLMSVVCVWTASFARRASPPEAGAAR